MKFIPTAVTSRFGRQVLALKTVSPQIMFGAGVVGVVGAGVLACKATLKLHDVLDASEALAQERRDIHEERPDDYTAEQLSSDETKIKIKTALTVGKLYAPAVGLGLVSVGLLTGSHCTLTRRNTSLMAAYAAADEAFKKYRERVRADAGEDKDREYRYGSQTVEETVEGKNGTKTTKHTRAADGEPSMYAKFFDELCGPHSKDPEYNAVFLAAQQQYANNKLKAQGHLLLNDVYDLLDIPRTKAGCIVGWIDNKGDSFVDFGIFDNIANPRVRDFVNGREHSILLDFNVDGVIYDQLGN